VQSYPLSTCPIGSEQFHAYLLALPENLFYQKGCLMKFLMVGLGSIGQRHVHNLRTVLGSEIKIIAYRTHQFNRISSTQLDIGIGDSIEKKYNIQTYVDFDQALAQSPKAAFVCNPSSLHISIALRLAQVGCHLFIEKPVSHSMDGLDRLTAIVGEKGIHVLVGFQFRFHPGLRLIKRLLQQGTIGSVVSAHAHWGEYLPSWHPWEDYRQSYSACADLGGGVILTLCHPFDYMRWLLGEVQAVSAAAGCLTGLELDVEDTADITLRFASDAIGTVHLDYVQRPPSHWLRIIGQDGTIEWNNADGAVRYSRGEKGAWETILAPVDFERNAMFLDEMRHFLDCITGRAKPLVTLTDGIRALEIALAAKRSAAEGRVIEVCDA
jgi:predicted dehydrogenase